MLKINSLSLEVAEQEILYPFLPSGGTGRQFNKLDERQRCLESYQKMFDGIHSGESLICLKERKTGLN